MVDFASLRQEPRIIAGEGENVGQVNCPYFMCLSHTGESIVVCDNEDSRIQEFFLDGRPTRVIVQYTDGTQPLGVALRDNGDYIVTDRADHRVMRIDQNGILKWAVGSYGHGPNEFDCPHGVCILSDDRVVVADLINNRLQVLNGDTGAVLGALARSDGEEWKSPWGITTDAQGLLYVVEYENHQVTVITAEGHVVRTLGSKGSGPGQLDSPIGAAVDGVGNVIVGDFLNSRIVVFHPDSTSSSFATPTSAYSAVITKNNRLVVSGDSFIAEY